MVSWLFYSAFFVIAAIPFIYYLIAIYSTWRFFRVSSRQCGTTPSFTPPVSILKPVRGLDPDAYENFASFCRQDYPEYEIVFCVGDRADPVLPVIEKVMADFPECRIRVLFGSGRIATNDKVAKLARLTNEAHYEHLVINDSDVRAEPGYLRTVVAPLADPSVGAVTCPVTHECLEFALGTNQESGVWGGLTRKSAGACARAPRPPRRSADRPSPAHSSTHGHRDRHLHADRRPVLAAHRSSRRAPRSTSACTIVRPSPPATIGEKRSGSPGRRCRAPPSSRDPRRGRAARRPAPRTHR